MSAPFDHGRIEELLQDGTLSFRAIAREVGCSDFTVRSIARQLSGDPRPMKRGRHARKNVNDEPLGLVGWSILAGIFALFTGAIWFGTRGTPPPENGP